jgi:hypothetical protein
VTHSFAQCLIDSKNFNFFKIEPEKVFYAGGFGVDANFVEAADYFKAAVYERLKHNSHIERHNTHKMESMCVLACVCFFPFNYCSLQIYEHNPSLTNIFFLCNE